MTPVKLQQMAHDYGFTKHPRGLNCHSTSAHCHTSFSHNNLNTQPQQPELNKFTRSLLPYHKFLEEHLFLLLLVVLEELLHGRLEIPCHIETPGSVGFIGDAKRQWGLYCCVLSWLTVATPTTTSQLPTYSTQALSIFEQIKNLKALKKRKQCSRETLWGQRLSQSAVKRNLK